MSDMDKIIHEIQPAKENSPSFLKAVNVENKSSQNPKHLGNITTLRAFKDTHNAIGEITHLLDQTFEQLAPQCDVKILGGVKGTQPNMTHALDFLIKVWNQVSSDEAARDAFLKEYVADFLQRIKKNPAWTASLKEGVE